MTNLKVKNSVCSGFENDTTKVAILKRMILLGAIYLFTAPVSFAQFVIEPFVSEDNLILESWYFNTIDQSKRLSVFSLNEINHNYDTESTSFLSYGVVGFDWKKGFGPIVGWRFSPYTAAALAGVQYGFYRENFFAIVNVSSELKSNPNLELYSMIQYRRPITEKLKGFTQLQISKNFVDANHAFSLYRLRVGGDFGKIQTGIGLEQTMAGEDWNHEIAPGLFLRLELY